jgi:hypothetical protein
VPDDLPADNEASILSLMLPSCVAGDRGNRFLEQRSSRAPGDAHRDGRPRRQCRRFRFTVLDDVLPTPPSGNVLRSVPPHKLSRWPGLTPGHRGLEEHTPLLRFVGFENVQIRGVGGAHAGLGRRAVEAANALMLAGELDRQRLIWIAFDTLQSTWPLRISFPSSCQRGRVAQPERARAAERLVRTGDAIHPAPPALASVHLPDGASRESLDAHARTRLRRHLATRRVPVQRHQPDHGVCEPARRREKGHHAQRAASGRVRPQAASTQVGNRELWRWLAGLALAVLLFEWWFYHKRTA